MLGIIQSKIEQMYRLNSCPEATKYLLSPDEFRAWVHNNIDQPQVLFLDQGTDASMGIYLGKKIFKNLGKSIKTFSFSDFCVMAEEVSHFIYLIWSKANGKKTSLLDLEIQGEIDKFMIASDFYRNEQVAFEKIFENHSFLSTLSHEDLQRYEFAHNLGKKLIMEWKRKKVSRKNKINWLRHFYRQNSTARIAMIESGA